MLQAGHRILIFIFGIDIEHHADLFLCFEITLKLRIDLSHRSLLSDLQVLYAVIPHDTAPERIVQIQYQRFLILAKDRLDDIGQTVGKRRDGLHTHSILIHMPVKGIRPLVQSIRCRLIVDVVNIESCMFSRILIEFLIEPV